MHKCSFCDATDIPTGPWPSNHLVFKCLNNHHCCTSKRLARFFYSILETWSQLVQLCQSIAVRFKNLQNIICDRLQWGPGYCHSKESELFTSLYDLVALASSHALPRPAFLRQKMVWLAIPGFGQPHHATCHYKKEEEMPFCSPSTNSKKLLLPKLPRSVDPPTNKVPPSPQTRQRTTRPLGTARGTAAPPSGGRGNPQQRGLESSFLYQFLWEVIQDLSAGKRHQEHHMKHKSGSILISYKSPHGCLPNHQDYD